MSATQLVQPVEFLSAGKPVASPVTLVDAQGYAIAGVQATAVAASTSDAVVKGAPGRLCRVLVTAAGTAATSIYDNANGHTGTVIGIVPASPAVGAFYEFQAPAANGITVAGAANTSALTVIWS